MMTGRLVPLTAGEAIPLLIDAFAADPVFRYFTGQSDPDAQAPLRGRIIEFIASLHIASGHRILGWKIDGDLVGCALVVDKAYVAPQHLGLLRVFRLAIGLGFGTLSRLNSYARISGRGRPAGVTHFLALIGLADSARGKGIGGQFVQALHARFGSTAYWALDTENPANLTFYARLGYHLYAQETLGPVTIYKLHRPEHTGTP